MSKRYYQLFRSIRLLFVQATFTINSYRMPVYLHRKVTSL